jgi:hypothetical protein
MMPAPIAPMSFRQLGKRDGSARFSTAMRNDRECSAQREAGK